MRTDWLNVSVQSTIFGNPLLLFFQIWYFANGIFRSLFPSTQGTVTCFNPYGFLSLPNYISEDLERIQRRALRIIYPDLSYSVALETAGLPKLHERSEKILTDLFDKIVCDPTHRLHSLLPQRKSCKYALRRKRDFTVSKCKTERLKNSFILLVLFLAMSIIRRYFFFFLKDKVVYIP